MESQQSERSVGHRQPLRIAVVGGGPGGLTFAALAADAGHDVVVHERREHGTFGAGVTLWPDHMEALHARLPRLVDRILEHAVVWQGQRFVLPDGDGTVRIPGTDVSGYGIDRTALLAALLEHAADQDLRIERGRRIATVEELGDVDLVVAADGAASELRSEQESEFGPQVRTDANRYAWLELDRRLEPFEYHFVRVADGWAWAYGYGHRPGASTVVVELTEASWRSEHLDALGLGAALARLQTLFGDRLGGRLSALEGATDRTLWAQFRFVSVQRWHAGRVALLGDAAHTTHFSIGWGTRLAMEDATGLIDALDGPGTLDDRLAAYTASRRSAIAPVVENARRSTRFFEELPRFIARPPADFVRLMERRRSRLLEVLPPRAYVGLSRLKDRTRGRRLPY